VSVDTRYKGEKSEKGGKGYKDLKEFSFLACLALALSRFVFGR
jgi:hypothetical protein